MPELYRSVLQPYRPPPGVSQVFMTFLAMVNDCLRLGLEGGASTFEAMKMTCYPRMLDYEVHNSYRVSAMFEAANLLKKYRTESVRGTPSRPFCRRPFISASVGVHLESNRLVLPDGRSTELNGHTLSVLSQPGVNLQSVTITPRSITLVYFKAIEPARVSGMIGLDLNLDNATTWDTSGRAMVYDLSMITRQHEMYRRIKSMFRRNDNRVKRRIYRKYSSIEWNRKSALLHKVSSEIITVAKGNGHAVAMEDLRGLRAMFRKRTGGSASYLSKMNAWPFARLQRMIVYKAQWVGLPVLLLPPEGTSSTCSACGGGMLEPPFDDRTLVCRECGLVTDRDLNAAKNILSRGLRSGHVGFASEAMMGPQALEREPKAKVDADHSPSQHE